LDSVSEHLHQKRRFLGARLWAANRRLWFHPKVDRLYPSLLFRSHCMSRAAVSVLEAAAAAFETRRGEGSLAAGMLEFLKDFIGEETGHDEWALEDLEALGISRQEVLARTPPPTLAALVGAQYYWIAHHHPVAVLGFCFVTESSPPSVPDIEDLIFRTGLPRTAFRTLLRHAAIDLKHGPEVERLLDRLPLTDAHLSTLGISMAHTLSCMADSAEEICDLYEIREKPAAGAEDVRARLY